MVAVHKILNILDQIYDAPTIAALHEAITEGISRLIPGDCYDLVLLDQERESAGVYMARTDTFTEAEREFLLKHAAQHPIVKAYARGASGALRVSQCESDRQWRSSAIYSEGGYRRMGLVHELAVEIPGVRQQSLAAFSVARSGPDFSLEDHTILNMLCPHIGRAWVLANRQKATCSMESLRGLYPVLSLREAEVLLWILEGKQNAEIAAILDRRLVTIQEHVENILRKLGMENRHQMTVEVLRLFMG